MLGRNKYLNEFDLLYENQAGFRSGSSTNDHIFSLYALTELLRFEKKKLHCAFIDFEKAFDCVHRNSLFYKLLENNIDGTFLRVIQNMYNDVKSYIRNNNECSGLFRCEIGVGENLSPVLFSLYLNYLQSYLEQNNVQGLKSVSCWLYIKLLILLYADDTILLAESETDLQFMLDNFDNFCDLWKLNINVHKT